MKSNERVKNIVESAFSLRGKESNERNIKKYEMKMGRSRVRRVRRGVPRGRDLTPARDGDNSPFNAQPSSAYDLALAA